MTLDAELQIHDALLSYCRGIDRLDGAAVLAGFHSDARLIDYAPTPVSIRDFVAHALKSLDRKYTATQHRLSNTRIDFDDRGALVESYVLAFHVEAVDAGADQLHTFNGRYIDRFTEDDGVWKISERTLRNDWSRVEPLDEKMTGAWPTSGRGDKADPLSIV